MQIKQSSEKKMTTSADPELRFDERYLASAVSVLNVSDARAASSDQDAGVADDLEQHARQITRRKCLDDCENAVADLSPNVVEYLLGVFDQISDSFLPAPLWQAPNTPSKASKGKLREQDVVLRSLRIVSAARLALASHGSSKDQQLKAKVERVYRAASRYLDSVPQYDSPEDIEALLLLAELEYGRNQSAGARTRLRNVIAALTESSRMRFTLIFGQTKALVRRRNALRTALMMLHWYFNEVPAPLEDLDMEMSQQDGPGTGSAEELFITSQLRLASLQHRLQRYVDAQPVVDDKVWLSCEQAFATWYEELSESSVFNSLGENAPVNFFVFHQQYLATRILLSKTRDTTKKKRSGVKSPSAQADTQASPSSARSDAIRIASSLRNYGQRHRFREAPLSFVNHISAAADIVLHATEAAHNEDDRNAYLHISSFLSGVLKYMAEVHVRAGTLLEAVQQRMNSVIQGGLTRSDSTRSRQETPSTYSNDSHLWQWTRYNIAEEFGDGVIASEPERPKSVIGLLPTSVAPTAPALKTRPSFTRQTSMPGQLAVHHETSAENTPAPSFYSFKAHSNSTIGPFEEKEDMATNIAQPNIAIAK